MLKQYPYLVDRYFESDNEKVNKRNYLATLDTFVNQKQYVKITLLDWDEHPLKEIQGEITGGSLTKNKDNAVRCTGSLSCSYSMGEYDIDNLRMDYAINKKVYIEIGIRNDTDQYIDYPILWFPQGVFFISGVALSSASNGAVNIDISLKDKMAMLDGSVGGTLPTDVQLDSYVIANTTETKKLLVYDIIMELVNHLGGESIDRIVIEDMPETAKRIIKWNDSNKAYFYLSGTEVDDEGYESEVWSFCPSNEYQYLSAEAKKNIISNNGQAFSAGQDIGYMYQDFIYDQELTVKAGSTITSALDTIKNWLGNYEYFYDEYGIFHFRKVKDYSQTSLATEIMSDTEMVNSLLKNNDESYYLTENSIGKSVYSFTSENLISVNVTPQYDNIKNDYTVHGTRTIQDTGATEQIWYHLAIDEKPEIDETGYTNILLYYENDYNNYVNICSPEPLASAETFPEASTDEIPLTTGQIYVMEVEGTTQEQRTVTLKTKAELLDYYNYNYNSTTGILEYSIGLNDYFTSKNIETIWYNLESYYKVNSWSDDQSSILQGELARLAALFNLDNFSYSSELSITSLPAITDIADIKLINNAISANGLLLTAYTTMKNYSFAANDSAMQTVLDNIVERYKLFQTKCWNIKLEIATAYEGLVEDLKNLKITSESDNTSHTIDRVMSFAVSQLEAKSWNGSSWNDISWHTYYPDGEIITSPHHNIEYTLEDLQNSEYTPSTNVNSKWYVNYYVPKQTAAGEFCYDDPSKLTSYVANDWRAEIVLQGLAANANGTDVNSYYYSELAANWCTMYNYITGRLFADEDELQLLNGNYFLDIIDETSGIYGEYSVNNIGRRSHVEVSDSVNCLFTPSIPDILFVNIDDEDTNLATIREQAISDGYTYTQINQDAYSRMATGGSSYGAYDYLKTLITQHTVYQKQINLTSIPIFYLEPNSRITVRDKSTNTYGDYIVSSISITLGAGNTMSISGTEVVEQVI